MTVLGGEPSIGIEKAFILLALLPAQARAYTAPHRVFGVSKMARIGTEGAWLVKFEMSAQRHVVKGEKEQWGTDGILRGDSVTALARSLARSSDMLELG